MTALGGDHRAVASFAEVEHARSVASRTGHRHSAVR